MVPPSKSPLHAARALIVVNDNTSVSRVEFPVTRIQSPLPTLLHAWNAVLRPVTAEDGRVPLILHARVARRGVWLPIYAGTIIKRERAREREDAEMTKPLVRPSEGPHESIAKGENVLRPSIRPFDLRFSPPPRLVLWPLFSIACALQHPFRDGQPPRNFCPSWRTSWFVQATVLPRFSCLEISPFV